MENLFLIWNRNQPVEFLAQEEPRMGLDGGLLEGIQDGSGTTDVIQCVSPF